jgi:hypothetical protein
MSTGTGGEPNTVTCEAPASACGESCVELATDPVNCGACGSACALQSSAFTCVDGSCGCTTPAACGQSSNDVACINRLCACNGVTCFVGETCERQGNQQRCRCNGGAACTTGQICCPTIGCAASCD